MPLPYTGIISNSTPVEITGITPGATIRVLTGPGLALDMDNSDEAGTPDWQEVHKHQQGGLWEGGMVGTKLRLRKDPEFASLKARIVEA